jgi:hypothetical protein
VKAARTRALNRKHAGTAKHSSTGKHTPSATKAGKAHKQVARRTAAQVKAAHLRGFTAGVSCCAAEAVAASLRLAGRPVSPADVLALYRCTADSPDAGASIVATLEAALAFGLAGVRPVEFDPVDGILDGLLGHLDVNLGRAGVVEVPHLDEPQHIREPVHGASVILGLDLPEAALAFGVAGVRPVGFEEVMPSDPGPMDSGLRVTGSSLILGLDLPEAPHAVTLDPSGAVWSWGALYDLTDEAVVDEVWAVLWP